MTTNDSELISRMYEMIVKLNDRVEHLQHTIDTFNTDQALDRTVIGKKTKSEKRYRKLADDTPTVSFDDFVQLLMTNIADSTEHAYKMGLLSGFEDLFGRVIGSKSKEQLPIRSFSKKSGVFYIYEEDKWSELSGDTLDQLIERMILHFRSNYMEQWFHPNQEQIQTNETCQKQYYEYMMNIIGGQLASDSAIRREHIRKILYRFVHGTMI